MNIDPGKTSPWGNVVSSGALAQNHQHLFCIRIDPAVDGHNNTVVAQESLPMPMTAEYNPYGAGYEVRDTPITKSTFFDASPQTNLTVKMVNESKLNPISGKPVSYKFMPTSSQLLLAHPDSVMAKRAKFAQHHIWVTKYKDGELWAGGEFTNMSQNEVDGVADAVARDEDVQNTDVVVWHTFGLTHNPRVEDWPVMYVHPDLPISSLFLRMTDTVTGLSKFIKSTSSHQISFPQIQLSTSLARRMELRCSLALIRVAGVAMFRKLLLLICKVQGLILIPRVRVSCEFVPRSLDWP